MNTHPLKTARIQHGWSQQYVAEQLGVSMRTVIRWEQGLTLPFPYYRERLCLLFNSTTTQLGLTSAWYTTNLEEQTSDTTIQLSQTPPVSGFHETIPVLDPLLPHDLGRANRILGRKDLLQQIKEHLLQGERLASTALQGLPGIGKTALAAAIATDPEIQQHFSAGILWAALGPQANVLSLLTRWGALLGLQASDIANPTNEADWTSALRAVIGARRFLLVIDDAWSTEAALALHIGGSQCAHLLTTRFPLTAYAFAQETTITIPELSEADGVALLARYVPSIVEQDPETSRLLVQATGGLPLALTLLGKYLSLQGLSGQPRRIKAALKRLQDSQQRLRISQTVPPHERPSGLSASMAFSLEATIELSVQLLSSQQQAALSTLALFPAKPNSFAERAAIAVTGASIEDLDALWDTGLLESSDIGRYTLHQTIVDYARMQPVDLAAQQRLSIYMIEYSQIHTSDFADLDLEMNNILTALDLATTTGEPDNLQRGVFAFLPFMQARGLYTHADRYLQFLLQKAQKQADEGSELRCLSHLATFAEQRGDYKQMEQYSQQGLALAQHLEQSDIQCDVLATLGAVAYRRGDFAQANAYHAQGVELARQLGDHERTCTQLNRLSRVATSQGNYQRAEELSLEGLVLAHNIKHQELISRLLATRGWILTKQGKFAAAEEHCLEALTIARQSGHREIINSIFVALGAIACERGENERAESYFKEGLAQARQIGHKRQIRSFLNNLGVSAGQRKDYVQAEQYLHEALELERQLGARQELPLFLTNIGIAIGRQGDYDRANDYFQEATELARQEGANPQLIIALISWGEHHETYQHFAAAEAAFQEVIDIDTLTTQSKQDVLQAQFGMARLAALRGDLVEARRLGQEVLTACDAISGYYRIQEIKQWFQSLPKQTIDTP